MEEKSLIPYYKMGSNISLLNVIYHKAVKLPNGKYDTDSIDLIYRDLNSNIKKLYHIKNPMYTFYTIKEQYKTTYPLMYIDKDKADPVKCHYTDVKKTIAQITNNLEFFYDNIRNGNYKENDKLFSIPTILNADMNIEDYYRWDFDKCYTNSPYQVSKLYFDIEVDTIDMTEDFPSSGLYPVNAVTLLDEANRKIITLLLINYKNQLIEEFRNQPNITTELKQFVQDNVGGWKNEKRLHLDEFEYNIVYYTEEIQLISDIFNYINSTKPDFAVAWNIAFDLPYLINRIMILGYDPKDIICHKDFKVKDCEYFIDKRADKFEEKGDYSQISSYTVYLDQLVTFASRRKGQRMYQSFKLDYIGNVIAGVRKLDYSHITTNISELPYKDYKTFVFYNIMDVIVQYCIEQKVGDIDFVFNKSLSTNTRYAKVHRQTVYLINRAIKDFWDMGYVMGNNNNKHNQKDSFAGAFVADPTLVSDKPKIKINDIPTMLCDNLKDFDYKALYPSIIEENNMAPYTQYGKILFPEQIDSKENKYNNDYFDRSVWFIEDLISGDRLNFCQRYLSLAGYETLYDDVLEYFYTIKASKNGVRNYDSVTGMKILVEPLPHTSEKQPISYANLEDTNKKERKMPNDAKESNNNRAASS